MTLLTQGVFAETGKGSRGEAISPKDESRFAFRPLLKHFASSIAITASKSLLICLN